MGYRKLQNQVESLCRRAGHWAEDRDLTDGQSCLLLGNPYATPPPTRASCWLSQCRAGCSTVASSNASLPFLSCHPGDYQLPEGAGAARSQVARSPLALLPLPASAHSYRRCLLAAWRERSHGVDAGGQGWGSKAGRFRPVHACRSHLYPCPQRAWRWRGRADTAFRKGPLRIARR